MVYDILEVFVQLLHHKEPDQSEQNYQKQVSKNLHEKIYNVSTIKNLLVVI